MKSSRIISFFLILTLIAPTSLYAADTENDYNAAKVKVLNVQATDPSLPSTVTDQKGSIGFIISKLFDSDGKIGNWFLKALGTRSDGAVLRWTGGNGGQFVQGSIYDTGSDVAIGAASVSSGLKLDVEGKIGATEYCDNTGGNCFSSSSVALSGSTVGGGGTAGYMTKFSGATTLTNSIVTDNGSQVGISAGTISAGLKLDVEGKIGATEYCDNNGVNCFSPVSGLISINGLSDGRYDGSSVYLGLDSGLVSNTGRGNVGVGHVALRYNTSGYYNTAVGYASMQSTTTGFNNAALGFRALQVNTTGQDNVAIGGRDPLHQNTTGSQNVAIGTYVLDANTTGPYNIGIGYNALSSNTTAPYNTAIGGYALDANTTGQKNLGIGYAALSGNTTANNNIAIGDSALVSNTIGAQNIAIGVNALDANSTVSHNMAIGYNALSENTTGPQNIAIGNYALDANVTGGYNTAIGYQALSNSTNSHSTAIGRYALRNATTGSQNTAIGSATLDAVTTGTYNTAVGYNSLTSLSTGNSNTAIGRNSMPVATGGANTTVGFNGLVGLTSGNYNTTIGYTAGDNITTGSNNIVIGYNVDAPSATASNQINIGNTIYGNRASGSARFNDVVHSGGYRENVASYGYNGTPTHGIKIKTELPFVNSDHMMTVKLNGYQYGNSQTIDLSIGWYIYNNVIYGGTISSAGGYAPVVKLANEGGKVVIFIDDRQYFTRFSVSAYEQGYGVLDAEFEGWTVVDEALTGTAQSTLVYENTFGDITAAAVATNCVGNCPASVAPPPSGNWSVNGDLNVTGSLSAANFYDEAPIEGTALKTATYVSNSAAWAAVNRMASVTFTVPAGPNRKYRIVGKAMYLGTNTYALYGIANSAGSVVRYTYEYGGGHGGWENGSVEYYVSLAPGTYTYYLQTYGGTSYIKSYHSSPAFTNVTVWPLQG